LHRELVVTRVFDAPRELVFRVWTEPERVRRWWGPEGFTMPYCDIDLRPGGIFLRCMRSPEGQDFWVTGVFREIVAPERLVITDSFADAEGNVVPPAPYGVGPDMPLERLVTVTFEEPAPRGAGSAWGMGLVDFSIRPHLGADYFPVVVDMAMMERAAARLDHPMYAIDDETAITVVDDVVEVVSEGEWRYFEG
jgi:uncharacterized protein YndB with AHSA1/START domain